MFPVILYLLAIVIANLSVAYFGPQSAPVNAFIFIGATFTLRDKLHDLWRTHRMLKMGTLILTGSLISYLLNRDAGQIAVASFVAFLLSESGDAVVYARLERYRWFVRVNGSNLVAAVLDSILFPVLAFGAWLPWIMLGQVLAKIGGGLVWSWILKPRRRVQEVTVR